MIGNGTLFGLLTAFWLLAYIHTQIMQNIYKHAITWSIPVAWILLTSSLVEFIRGGKQKIVVTQVVRHEQQVSLEGKRVEYKVLPGKYNVSVI